MKKYLIIYFTFVFHQINLTYGGKCSPLNYNKCTKDEECCSKYCMIAVPNTRGLCSPLENKPSNIPTLSTRNCFYLGYNKCTKNSDCCSNYCEIEQYHSLGSCREPNSNSNNNNNNNINNNNNNNNNPVCKPNNFNKCSKDEECCSKKCSKVALNSLGVCLEGPIGEPGCNINGLTCKYNRDCCSDYCNGNVCTDFVQTPPTKVTTEENTPTEGTCGKREPKFNSNEEKLGYKNAQRGQYPWTVSFQKIVDGSYLHFCSGTLISSKHVLSAAHCFKDVVAENTFAFTNITDLNYRSEENWRVEKIYNHPNYSSDFQNDISVIKLLDEIEPLDMKSQFPICLAIEGDELSATDTVHVTSWTLDKKLKDFTIVISDSDVCSYRYEKLFKKGKMICASDWAKHTKVCQTDPGGALMSEYEGEFTIYGIVLNNFGQSCVTVRTTPGVYTKVSKYYHWIKDQMKK